MEDLICLVSPFAENGSLPDYLEKNPNANKHVLVSSKLCFDFALRQLRTFLQLFQTALAIAYLHKSGVIHGDIKGDNILVSREHSALLSDFGLARLEGLPTSEGRKGKGSVPWQSPEILNGQSKSYESDMYAFGMTIYEVREFSQLIGYTF